MEDRRTARTRKALKQAMLALLDKKDIAKITVSELSELADIGRGTFYLHYADPYDLLDKLEDELLDEVMARNVPVAGPVDTGSLMNYLEGVWQYLYDRMDVIKILTNRRNNTRFMAKFKRRCEVYALSAIRPEGSNDCEAIYAVIYLVSGSLGIFERWIEDGAPIPPDKLAQLV